MIANLKGPHTCRMQIKISYVGCFLMVLCTSQNTLLTEFRRIQSQLDIPFALQGALIGGVSHWSAGEVTPVRDKWRIRNQECRKAVGFCRQPNLFEWNLFSKNNLFQNDGQTRWAKLTLLGPTWFWGRNRLPAVDVSHFAYKSFHLHLGHFAFMIWANFPCALEALETS